MALATAIRSNKRIDIKNNKLFPLFKRKHEPPQTRDNRPLDQRWTASSEKISSLTVRILAVNIIAIMILGAGVLYLGEYTNSLVEGELESLRDEARFVSDALSEGAVRPVYQLSPNPFEPPMEIEAVKPSLARGMLARLGRSSKSRIKLYSVDSTLLADTNELSIPSDYVQQENLNKKDPYSIASLFDQSAGRFLDIIPNQTKLPKFPQEVMDDVFKFPDLKSAMLGTMKASAWTLPDGTIVLTAAAPVQKIKQVLGVTLLVRDGSELEEKISQIRVDVFRVFLGSLGITVMLSIYLSGLIGKPLKKLALAAEAVRIGKDRNLEIPDMSARGDEIGELSLVLRDMTQALRDRMDSIERFAADVSHEIKNPLTSLRSAVETASKIKDEDKRQKLMDIIHHDVRRLDRLISDISSASRLDSELSREEMSRINITNMLYRLRDAYKDPMERVTENSKERNGKIIIANPDDSEIFVLGNEERLAQVFGNLISNALSFSPPKGVVKIEALLSGQNIVISFEDDGTGIPQNKLETIFERFYTERPTGENYGSHSGLGLSISKQIIEAHGGEIWAENKRDGQNQRIGAIFKVKLQAA